MRLPSPFGLILATTALLVLPSPGAVAKPQFARDIETHLALPYRPACRLCHIQSTTGAGSVQTPFGVSMLGHGLSDSQKTVLDALDALAADKTDSDGDGASDVAELSANTDPNTPVDVPLGSDEASPKFGCAVARHGAPGGAAAMSVGALLAGLGLAIRRMRRRAAAARH